MELVPLACVDASICTTALFGAVTGIKSSASIFTAVLFEALIGIKAAASILYV